MNACARPRLRGIAAQMNWLPTKKRGNERNHGPTGNFFARRMTTRPGTAAFCHISLVNQHDACYFLASPFQKANSQQCSLGCIHGIKLHGVSQAVGEVEKQIQNLFNPHKAA